MKIAISLIAILFLSKLTIAQNFWEPTNGPFGGYILSLAINDNGHVFAGTLSSGIYRSSDQGQTWKTSNNGLITTSFSSNSVRELAVESNSVIYAAVSGQESGLFKSTNGGDNWEQSGLESIFITAMIIDSNGFVYAGGQGGIYKSTNMGTSWTNILFSNYPVSCITQTPNGYIFAADVGGIVYRSTNSGINWLQMLTFNLQFHSICTTPNGGIFVGSYGKIHYTSDYGNTWALRSNLPSKFIWSLMADNGGNVYAGIENSGIYFSNDNGLTWVTRNIGLTDSTVYSIKKAPDGSIYVGTIFSGVFRSSNSGINWYKTNLPSTFIITLECDIEGRIFAGGHQSSSFRSTNSGLTWDEIHIGYPWESQILSFSSSPNGTIYAGGQGNGAIFKSTNNGDNWTKLIQNGICWSMDVNSQGTVFAAIYLGNKNYILKSTNEGESWIETGLSGSVWKIHIGSDDNIYIGADSSILYLSTDNGESWSQIHPYNILTAVYSITTNSFGNIFIGLGDQFLNGSIKRSTNNGLSWVTVLALPTTSIYALAVNSIGDIFAATYGEGVYYSTDNGDSWSELNSGLENMYIRCLTFDSDERILAGTAWGGVYISRSSTTLINVHEYEDFWSHELFQNYPNPFNPITNIKFSIPTEVQVNLSVFNILGEKIKELKSEVMKPGFYEVEFDATNIASGVYFYRIQAGDYVQTKKKLLLR